MGTAARYHPAHDDSHAPDPVRAGSIILVLAAIVAQAIVLAGQRWHLRLPTRFFAYFTILSNLIGVAAFVWLLVDPRCPAVARPRTAARRVRPCT